MFAKRNSPLPGLWESHERHSKSENKVERGQQKLKLLTSEDEAAKCCSIRTRTKVFTSERKSSRVAKRIAKNALYHYAKPKPGTILSPRETWKILHDVDKMQGKKAKTWVMKAMIENQEVGVKDIKALLYTAFTQKTV